MISSILSPEQMSLLVELKQAGIVMFGAAIRDKYGLRPPVYLDLRENLYQRADLIWRVGGEIARKICSLAADGERVQGVIGVPDTATPLALTATLYAWQQKMVPSLRYLLLRQEGKVYGSAPPSYVIGERGRADFEYNLVDDVVASGLSKWKAIEKLGNDGIRVRRIIAFFDRQQGGTEMLQQEGFQVDSVFRLTDVIDFYLQEKLIGPAEHGSIRDFLKTHHYSKPLWAK